MAPIPTYLFTTCRRDLQFNSIWQSKAKLSWDVPTITSTATHQRQHTTPTPSITSPTIMQFDLDAPPNADPPQTDMLPSEFHHKWNELLNDTDMDSIVSSSNNFNDAILPPRPSESQTHMAHVTRSGRVSKSPQQFAESVHSAHSAVCAYLSTFSVNKEDGAHHIIQPMTTTSSISLAC